MANITNGSNFQFHFKEFFQNAADFLQAFISRLAPTHVLSPLPNGFKIPSLEIPIIFLKKIVIHFYYKVWITADNIK